MKLFLNVNIVSVITFYFYGVDYLSIFTLSLLNYLLYFFISNLDIIPVSQCNATSLIINKQTYCSRGVINVKKKYMHYYDICVHKDFFAKALNLIKLLSYVNIIISVIHISKHMMWVVFILHVVMFFYTVHVYGYVTSKYS